MRHLRLVAAGIAIAIVTVPTVVAARHDEETGRAATRQALVEIKPAHAAIATAPASVIGVYVPGLPNSMAALKRFQSLTGTKLRIAMYYSAWGESFQASFAAAVDHLGIIPLVQIDPDAVSLAEIADGSQDGYLVSYADAVRFYGRAVIVSFGHEMNSDWYRWGYRNSRPAEFIAAWRHIVTVFRSQGADNVTWLWTVNSIAGAGRKSANPDAWWPGRKYVTWAGIDGYYYRASDTFAALFAPTLTDMRKVTRVPILITETGAAPRTGEPGKVANLFAGVKANHMLGLVWFDARGRRDWRIDTPAAIAAFHKAAGQAQ
jgi:mannan endo-1,4-beta-mannosidase